MAQVDSKTQPDCMPDNFRRKAVSFVKFTEVHASIMADTQLTCQCHSSRFYKADGHAFCNHSLPPGAAKSVCRVISDITEGNLPVNHDKTSTINDSYHLKAVDPCIRRLKLEQGHDVSLRPFVESLRKKGFHYLKNTYGIRLCAAGVNAFWEVQ